MSNAKHSDLRTVDIHPPIRWEFADSTARTATTDPNTSASYQAGDISNFARQNDDDTIWMLIGTTPDWVKIGGATSGKFSVVQDDANSVIQLKVTDSAYDLTLIPDNGSGGYVGINTNSPSTELELVGENPTYQIRNSASSPSYIDIDFQFATTDLSGATAARIEASLNAAKGELAFYTGGDSVTDSTEMVRINKDGQVSIAGTSPVAGSKLDVAGDIVVSDGAGAAKVTLSDDVGIVESDISKTFHPKISYLGQIFSQSVIAAGATVTIATFTSLITTIPVVIKVFGQVRTSGGTPTEIFELTAAYQVSTSTQIINFTSFGATAGAAFLASTDFSMVVSGADVLFKYTNNTALGVQLRISFVTAF